MIRNSMKQMVRVPLVSLSFLLLIALSAFLLTMGVVLCVNNSSTIHNYEDNFITIGTVEQKAFSVSQRTEWDAELKDYRLFQKAEYSDFLPISKLSFKGANYINKPEKRSYYGSYAPEFILWNILYPYRFPIIIAEISPIEDCVPDESVKVKVNRVLFGESSLEGTILWFCNHYTKIPKPLEKGKNYAVVLSTRYWGHGRYYEDEKYEEETIEYVPNELKATQYEYDGTRIEDILDNKEIEESPYYEITENFYYTDIGKRLLNLVEGYSLLKETMPVTGTNDTKLLMSFYRGDSYISAGRDITEEEYDEGKKVCLIPKEFAENNLLTIGDSIHLQLYFTNSKFAAGQIYSPNAGGVEQWLPITRKGEAPSVFEDSHYTIVGIYDSSSNVNSDSYSMGMNEVVVPLASIINQNSCNIMEFGPMAANTTSFQIPNGNIEEFLSEWEKYGTDELEINFYDMGYSRLQSGLENMKRVSLLLLMLGILMSFFLLIFYSHLFINNQKERIAIERCLGLDKKQCINSILSGILILLFIGSFLGSSLGGMLSLHISAENMNQMYYDSYYSNIVDIGVEDVVKKEGGNTSVVIIASISTGISINIIGVGISMWKINKKLKENPIKLITKK